MSASPAVADLAIDTAGAASVTRAPTKLEAAARLAVINGLRGYAILAVLYYHYLTDYLTPFFFIDRIRVGNLMVGKYTLVSNGWLGVNLFFILSGFVLSLPYALGQRSMKNLADVKAFYARRALRLLPLYYLVLFVTMFIATSVNLWSSEFLNDFSALATFTFVFSQKLFLPRYNAVLWSLGVEVWFSVLFPLLLLASRRFGIGLLMAAALILSFGVRYYAASTYHGSSLALLLPLKDGPFGRLDDFVVGMALCHVYVHGRLPARGQIAALMAAVALLFVSAAAWDNVRVGRLPYTTAAIINDFVQAGFALAIGSVISGGLPKILRRMFTAAPIQLCGMMSYSLYLWHMAGPVQRTAPWWDLKDVPVYFAILLLLAAMSYRYIEFPRKSWRELFASFPR